MCLAPVPIPPRKGLEIAPVLPEAAEDSEPLFIEMYILPDSCLAITT